MNCLKKVFGHIGFKLIDSNLYRISMEDIINCLNKGRMN